MMVSMNPNHSYERGLTVAKLTPEQEKIEALMAELAAAKAEVVTLKGEVAKKGAGKPREAKIAISEADMAAPDSLLGHVQRLPFPNQMDALPKLVRQLGVGRLCALIVQLGTEVAKAKTTKEVTVTVDEIVNKATTRNPRAPKGEKVIDDATAAAPEKELQT